MKILNQLFLNLLLLASISVSAQSQAYEESMMNKSGTLEVHYFESEPICFVEEGKLKGIEIEILERFAQWLQDHKGVSISLNYTKHEAFDDLYNSIKAAKGSHIGVGTITRTRKRELEVDFSAPYLRNVSVLVSAAPVKTARSQQELKELLINMEAYTIKGSIHEEHLQALYDGFGIAPKINYVKDPVEIFEKIKESPRNLGYVDVITFWKYIKSADEPIKMHKIANSNDEYFGFIFPKNSGWAFEFNEFFESGFGFTSTKEYHKILEKYLSYEIMNSVELLPY
ncbi:MAG: hypothetical protein CMP59_12730 [Flavobacteriales bacterium]|nr:hypothetical protein [Flavobacteriales bacterium]